VHTHICGETTKIETVRITQNVPPTGTLKITVVLPVLVVQRVNDPKIEFKTESSAVHKKVCFKNKSFVPFTSLVYEEVTKAMDGFNPYVHEVKLNGIKFDYYDTQCKFVLGDVSSISTKVKIPVWVT
jgi:hypothetical protein